jgi:Uma2 family endonuclease
LSVSFRKPMTLAEFLAWEERQAERWEFDGVQPVAMTGGTLRHEMIGGALRALLHGKLRGTPCRVVGPTMKVEVVGRIRYPDAFVYCTPAGPSDQVIRDPDVVFEVLSPSTSRIDRIVKLQEYQATDSIRHYVILEQDSVAATVFSREGRLWTARVLIADDTLAMPEIGIELALADLYIDADLPPVPDDFDGDLPAAR